MKKVVCILLIGILMVGLFTGCRKTDYSEEINKAIAELKTRGRLGFTAELNKYNYDGPAYISVKYNVGNAGIDYLESLAIVGENRHHVSMYADNANNKIYNGDYYLVEEDGSLDFDVKQALIELLSVVRGWSWEVSENKVNLVLKHKLTEENVNVLCNQASFSSIAKTVMGNALTKDMLKNLTLVLMLDLKTNKLTFLSFDLTDTLKSAVDSSIESASLKVNLTRETNVEMIGSVISKEEYEALNKDEEAPTKEPSEETNETEENNVGQETVPSESQEVETEPSEEVSTPESSEVSSATTEAVKLEHLWCSVNDVVINDSFSNLNMLFDAGWSLDASSDVLGDLVDPNSQITLVFVLDSDNVESRLTLRYVNNQEEGKPLSDCLLQEVSCTAGDPILNYNYNGVKFTLCDILKLGDSKDFVLASIEDAAEASSDSEYYGVVTVRVESSLLTMYIDDAIGLYGFTIERVD